MNIHLSRPYFFLLATIFLLSACSVAKLEARLEANPQCKDAINPKTGALMPCPGSDKAFYREVGLAPAKPNPASSSPVSAAPATAGTSIPSQTKITNVALPAGGSTQVDCKPQIHKKTGGSMPCPTPD